LIFEAERGILKDMDTNWPEISGFHSALEDLVETNPRYEEGPGYQENCQRCVPAFEMRRRGFDVTAMPRVLSKDGRISKNDILTINDNWRRVFDGVKWERTRGSGKDDIIAMMETWGEGARAEIYVVFVLNINEDEDETHVFAAIREDGVTKFVDPQNAKDAEFFFDYVEAGKTEVARIDNLTPTNLIEYCCEGREKK
jgi:hypothetical protein